MKGADIMKRNISGFITGILVGAILFCGGAAYAAGVMAEHNPQTVYVDGEAVRMDAYSINGTNYVKLRDIGEALGFNVYWDGEYIQVDTDTPYTGTGPVQANITSSHGLNYNADGSINVPTDGSKYIPQAGDRVRCDDGYIYEIKDVRRYDNNVFADGPVGPLPTPTCDWNAFPEVEVPVAEVRHFAHDDGDSMFIRNIFETRRMQYTIYNTLGREPSAWKDGRLLASVQLTIPSELEPYTSFAWPWRSSDLENLVHSCPNSRFYVEAWDYYSNGIFQHTRYCVASL